MNVSSYIVLMLLMVKIKPKQSNGSEGVRTVWSRRVEVTPRHTVYGQLGLSVTPSAVV